MKTVQSVLYVPIVLVVALLPLPLSAMSPIDERLITAAYSNDLNEIENLLDQGANVNARNARGTTALIWATINNNAEIVQTLLARGARINQLSDHDDVVIIWAARYNRLEIILTLLEQGAHINTQGSDRTTPLIWAAKNNNLAMVQALLARGATVNAQNNSGQTALSWAAINNNREMINTLLKAGASPHLRFGNSEIIEQFPIVKAAVKEMARKKIAPLRQIPVSTGELPSEILDIIAEYVASPGTYVPSSDPSLDPRW